MFKQEILKYVSIIMKWKDELLNVA
jgi:hypothetical protein